MVFNNYKQDMLCANILKEVLFIITKYTKILDVFNHTNFCNLKLRNISIIKAIPSANGKSINLYYVIRGNVAEQKFFQYTKSEIIRKLKKFIKRYKFPIINFIYDKNYDQNLLQTIRALNKIEEENKIEEKIE